MAICSPTSRQSVTSRHINKYVVTWRDEQKTTILDIKDDMLYTIKESSKIADIPERTLSRIALKIGARKIDRQYLFSGGQIKTIVEQRNRTNSKKDNVSPTSRHSPNVSPNVSPKKGGENSFSVADIQDLKLEDIINQDFKFKREGEFPKEGNFVFVPKDFVYAEYTEWEYKEAEDKLKEWQYQKQQLIDQQKTFDNLIKTQKEQTLFYKNQVKYYQKLADRTLSMHEKLLETIQTQTKDRFIDTTIRAKKTDWNKKDKK